jgi:hypothetical protein
MPDFITLYANQRPTPVFASPSKPTKVYISRAGRCPMRQRQQRTRTASAYLNRANR